MESNMHMRSLGFLLIFSLFSLTSLAQSGDYYQAPEKSNVNIQIDTTENNLSLSNENAWTSNPELRIGTSIGSFGGTPYMSSFFSPALRIQPPGKFSLSVGTSFSFSNSMYQAMPESSESYYQKMASYQLFAMGSYRVNENLNVRGGMSVTYFPGNNLSLNQNGYKQGHIGFDLRISEKTWISADFNFGEQSPYYSPYHFNSFNNNMGMPGFYPYRGF
jgi:long-subunit fatty acid transport protein